jgi:hypothetical protein
MRVLGVGVAVVLLSLIFLGTATGESKPISENDLSRQLRSEHSSALTRTQASLRPLPAIQRRRALSASPSFQKRSPISMLETPLSRRLGHSSAYWRLTPHTREFTSIRAKGADS